MSPGIGNPVYKKSQEDILIIFRREGRAHRLQRSFGRKFVR